MKYFFALLFCIPLLSIAQDCKIKKFNDQFSQEPKISTGFVTYSSTRLTIDGDAKELDFFFSLNNGESKCFDDMSTLTITFDGKTKMNYRNTGTMNCEGLFHLTFKNMETTPGVLTRLLTKKVTTLTFNGTNKSVTVITLSPEQQEQFAKIAACAVEEAKTLIKKP